MDEQICISSYMLGLECLNHPKYGTAIVLAKCVKTVLPKVDLTSFVSILSDTDKYLKYKKEEDYIKAVIEESLPNQAKVVFASAQFNGYHKKSKEYARYIVNLKEIHTLKKVWKVYITKVLEAYRENNMHPDFEIVVRKVSNMYDYNSMRKAQENFSETFKIFLNYHCIEYKEINFSFKEDDSISILVKL